MDAIETYTAFNPDKYLDTFYNPKDDEDWKMIKFELDELHNLFTSGEIPGKRLLDVGTGPSIHTIISASKYVDEIDLSDYAIQNLNFLRSWRNSDKTLQPSLIEYVLNKESKGESIETRNDLIKEKIKNIIPIDITRYPVLQLKEFPAKYDVITSCGCIDAAATTKEEYSQCVRNLHHLLANGGHCITIGDINESFYTIGNFKFQCLVMDGEDIQNTFKRNGFKIIHWKEAIYTSSDSASDSHGTFLLVAKKII